MAEFRGPMPNFEEIEGKLRPALKDSTHLYTGAEMDEAVRIAYEDGRNSVLQEQANTTQKEKG